ncbi:unnamed protein product [Gordionus sp. m RMFG-2023]|uniref:uncharacterized protein LOC135928528 n=1 Tax=Gordionus sp. m RMFG-2023 TaxID=3053472 RepID=UPI0030DFEA32
MDVMVAEEVTSNEDESDVFSDITPKTGNSNSATINDIIDILKPNEVRWFYSSPKKTWIPFLGYDSYRIELAYRQLHSSLKGLYTENFEPISVRGDLYEVDIIVKKCLPIYWHGDPVDVMRGTWFFDVGWQPLDEEYATQIEVEHLSKFAGWKANDTVNNNIIMNNVLRDNNPKNSLDDNKYLISPKYSLNDKSLLAMGKKGNDRDKNISKGGIKNPPLSPTNRSQSLFYQTSPTPAPSSTITPAMDMTEIRTNIPDKDRLDGKKSASVSPMSDEGANSKTPAGNESSKDKKDADSDYKDKGNRKDFKKKTATSTAALHTLKFKDFYVEWYNPNEVYMFSLATSSKLYRSLTYALGFQKTGLRLNRGYCILANDSDKPPDIQHIVFVIHGIGAKLDTSKCIKNCGIMRDHAAKLKQKCISDKCPSTVRAEFFPIEWRANLKLDDGAVDMISPKNVIGLRSILNTTVMDIMYYTSPIFRNEILTGVQKELNRLYQMFCAKHPNFSKFPQNKVSIIAHSLGTVIIHDILSGWNPSYIHQNYVDQTLSDCIEDAKDEVDKKRWSKFAENLKAQVLDIESKLNYIRKDRNSLKFKVENLFLLGSPLAVFLVMRGISLYGRKIDVNAGNEVNDQIDDFSSLADSSKSYKSTSRYPHRSSSSLPTSNAGNDIVGKESLQQELEKMDQNSNRSLRFSICENSTSTDSFSDKSHKPKISVLLPKHICNHVYNIYHPADPVAYRLEPLISLGYIRVKPLPIHKCDLVRKILYGDLPLEFYPLEPVEPQPQTEEEAEIQNLLTATKKDSTISSPLLNASNPISNINAMMNLSVLEKAVSKESRRDIRGEEIFPTEGHQCGLVKEDEQIASPIIDPHNPPPIPPPPYSSYLPRASWAPNLDFIKTYWRRSSSDPKYDDTQNPVHEKQTHKTNSKLLNRPGMISAIKSGHEADISEYEMSPKRSGNTSDPSTSNMDGLKIKYYTHPKDQKLDNPKEDRSSHKRNKISSRINGPFSSLNETGTDTSSQDEGILFIEDRDDDVTPLNKLSTTASSNIPKSSQSRVKENKVEAKEIVNKDIVINPAHKTVLLPSMTALKKRVNKSKGSKSKTPDEAGSTLKDANDRSGQDGSANQDGNTASIQVSDEDIPKLEYRVDYTLPSGWTIVNTYVSAITAHTSYWNSPDVIYFILQHLFPD